MAAALAGCAAPESAEGPDRTDARILFGDADPGLDLANTGAHAEGLGAADQGARAPDERAWSLVVVRIPADRLAASDQILSEIQTSGGLAEAWLERRGAGHAVVVGQTPDPLAPEAVAELERVRSLTVGGRRPYSAAFYAPPVARGTGDDADLAAVRTRTGGRFEYTLQVAYFGQTDRRRPTDAEIRRWRDQAVRLVARLRAEGEQAFYYHAPFSSTVTVGLFPASAVDTSDPTAERPRLSADILAAQGRFPIYQVNGEPSRIRRVTTDGRITQREQPTILVRIP